MTLPRPLPLAFGSSLLVGGAAFALTRAQRFVWLNNGLRIDSLPSAVLGFLVAAVGAALLAFCLRRAARVAATLLLLVAGAQALQAARYSVLAEDAGISERGLLGTTSLAWGRIARVEAGSRYLVLWGPGETQVRIDGASISPEDRARLERTVARRVKEHSR